MPAEPTTPGRLVRFELVPAFNLWGAAIALSLFCTWYSDFEWIWCLGHSGAYPSKFTPWLAIPAEEYYRWNLFLLPPSMFAGWLLASAVVQIASRPLGGTGRFEDTVAALGFACSAAHWALLPHDVLVGILGGLHVIDGRGHEHAMNQPTIARTLLWTFLALYILAFPWFFSRALAGVHRVRGARAMLLGVLGFAVYQLVFVVFNR